jgi:hypothetical protein
MVCPQRGGCGHGKCAGAPKACMNPHAASRSRASSTQTAPGRRTHGRRHTARDGAGCARRSHDNTAAPRLFVVVVGLHAGVAVAADFAAASTSDPYQTHVHARQPRTHTHDQPSGVCGWRAQAATLRASMQAGRRAGGGGWGLGRRGAWGAGWSPGAPAPSPAVLLDRLHNRGRGSGTGNTGGGRSGKRRRPQMKRYRAPSPASTGSQGQYRTGSQEQYRTGSQGE